ncbi:MAG: RPA family protein [Methermicoccaceae archaeon]
MSAVRNQPMREVARRVFAGELDATDLSYRRGEDRFSPNYILTPTGAQCNRVYLVGTLTEMENIGTEVEYWRARVVDPTGVYQIYAGQYQPEAVRTLTEIEPPAFVAVVGKVSTFKPEDGSVRVTIRPEFVAEVDEEVRDRWIIETAKLTIERLEALRKREGEEVLRAIEHYNTDIIYYAKLVNDALTSLPASGVRREETGEPKQEKPDQEEIEPVEEPQSDEEISEQPEESESIEEFEDFDEIEEIDVWEGIEDLDDEMGL